MSIVAAIVNSRPLSLRTTPDGDFHAISPRDVLLGKAGRSRNSLETELETALGLEDDERIELMEDAQSRIVVEWRRKWLAQVFVDMVPRTKWKTSHRNLQVGDIGHVHYDEKLGPQSWRIARIESTKIGPDGLVRTIVVSL